MSESVRMRRSRVERLLFDRPVLYKTKRLLIERVLWDWVFSRMLRLELRPMPERLPEAAGRSVLLAASGPGHATTGPSVEAAREVVAFDLSPRFAVACARHRPGWRVFCGDLLDLPFRDGAFELGVLYSTLHHVPVAAERVLSELSRVCGGRIVLVEGVVPERGPLRWLLLLWYRLVDGGQHYYTLGDLHRAVNRVDLRVASEGLYGPIEHMWLSTLEPAGDAAAPHADQAPESSLAREARASMGPRE